MKKPARLIISFFFLAALLLWNLNASAVWADVIIDNGGQWNFIGSYAFTAGVSYNITITSQPGPSSTCADAVRFVLH